MAKTVLVLGAGASRGVSYRHKTSCPSPLDRDFFDLLQRTPCSGTEDTAKINISKRLDSVPYRYRQSMEGTFYTLHLHDLLAEKLRGDPEGMANQVIEDFALVVQAVLRGAHGKNTCLNHHDLIQAIVGDGLMISFNYDLVVERAIRTIAKDRKVEFTPWFYDLFGKEPERKNIPQLLKLHGSANWEIERTTSKERFVPRTKEWDDFTRWPGYKAKSHGAHFPILMPFWDKRIEEDPWLRLWRRAFKGIKHAEEIIVWGYSLPPTDVKALQMFQLAVEARKAVKLCVIDPSQATRDKWRELYHHAEYWEFPDFDQFRKHPPGWCKLRHRDPATLL